MGDESVILVAMTGHEKVACRLRKDETNFRYWA